LDVIEVLIEEIVVTVEEESIRTQYVSSQRVILEALRCYNAYANMTDPQDASYWHKEFLKWGSFVRESVNFLLDGMLGTGFIASDILQSMVIISKNNPIEFKNRTDIFFGLLNAGLYVHGAYCGQNNQSLRVNSPVRDQFEAAYFNVSRRVNETILELGGTLEEPLNTDQRNQQDTVMEFVKEPPKREKRQTMVVTIKVLGIVENMFGIFTSGLGIYDHFAHPSTQDLMDEILAIQQQLEGITEDLKQVINLVKDASLRTQYVSSQRIIVESLRIVNYYVNMTEMQNMNTTQEDIDYWQSEFAKWGSLLRESVSFLMDGLLGRGFISGDIIKEITLIENHNPTMIQYRFDRFIGLVNVGLYVHALYAQFTNISDAANAPVRSVFESSYTAIGSRIEVTVRMQETDQVVKNIMYGNMYGDTMSARETLYAALKRRYDQRDWFVIVFKYDKDYFYSSKNSNSSARLPGNEQYFDNNFYYVTSGGKDAVAISFPTKLNTKKVELDSTTISQIDSYDCNENNQHSAYDLVNAMHRKVDPYCPGINIGAIPKEWCTPCAKPADWHATSWEAYKFGPFVGGKVKSCDNKSGGTDNNRYQPFAIYNVPPTRKFTVPEDE